MLRRIVLAATSLAAGATLVAPALAAPADSGGPLVYVFSLDGLDGDRVDAGGAPNLSAFLKQQGARSTYFPESRSIFVAETNPNHTAMGTGAYGDASGIPGNAFAIYGRLKAEGGEQSLEGDTTVAADDSCVLDGPIDETKPPTETSGESPNCLLAETFFQTVQARPDREEITTAGIFGKPKLGRIFAGRRLDPRRYDADYLWTPCPDFPSSGESPPYCDPSPTVEARPADSYAIDDSDVMDEVMRTVREGVRGDGRTFARPTTGEAKRPQLTFVNFPAIDTAGHALGTETGAYNQMITDVDDDIRRFVAQQKQLGLWERTTMVVLSDHSMETTGQKTTLGRRFQTSGVPSTAYKIIQNGSATLVYLADRRPSPQRDELLKKLRAAALDAGQNTNPLTGPAAAEALYREPNPADGGNANTLAAVHPGYSIAGARTGDLVVNTPLGASFNEGSVGNPLVGNHGGGQTRDNFLAVVGGSPAIREGAVTGERRPPFFDDTLVNLTSAENVDVAPTVLRLLGRPTPAQSQGRFLTEAFDERLVPAPVPNTGPLTPGTTPPGTVPPGTTPTPGTRQAPQPAKRSPARLLVTSRRVRASRSGRIVLKVTCAGADGQRCVRTLRVLRGRLTIGRRRLSVKAGAKSRVVVRLDKRSRRSLSRRRSIQARVLGRTVRILPAKRQP